MKAKSKWSIGKRIRFALFVIGVVFTVTAWLLDNAIELRPVLNIVAPRYASVKDVFDQLDLTKTSTVSAESKGARILLEWWPSKPPKDLLDNVKSIGRSAGMLNTDTGRHRYELLLLDKNALGLSAPYIWNDYEAKKLMEGELRSGLLKWKGVLFLFSLAIVVASGFWEFFAP